MDPLANTNLSYFIIPTKTVINPNTFIFIFSLIVIMQYATLRYQLIRKKHLKTQKILKGYRLPKWLPCWIQHFADTFLSTFMELMSEVENLE